MDEMLALIGDHPSRYLDDIRMLLADDKTKDHQELTKRADFAHPDISLQCYCSAATLSSATATYPSLISIESHLFLPC